ncbi:MAG: hypothetical protein K2X98_06010, partial [Alphaproteobacteria bacterium]|nr:hypothetical protein [Alphaproteobacteria bacterium]
MKNVLYTLAALLTTTALVSAESGGDNDAVSSNNAPVDAMVGVEAPAVPHHHKAKKIKKDDVKKSCAAHAEKAKKDVEAVSGEAEKVVANGYVNKIETDLGNIDKLNDTDTALLQEVDATCKWNADKAEKHAKADKRRQAAAKKKADAEAKKAAKGAHKDDMKKEEHKDEAKKEEP